MKLKDSLKDLLKDLFTKWCFKIGNNQQLPNELLIDQIKEEQKIKNLEEQISQLTNELNNLKSNDS